MIAHVVLGNVVSYVVERIIVDVITCLHRIELVYEDVQLSSRKVVFEAVDHLRYHIFVACHPANIDKCTVSTKCVT